MSDFSSRSVSDHPLPELPPVSHMELGRQEALVPPRQPSLSTSSQPVGVPEPVTLDTMLRLLDEVDHLPCPAPLLEPAMTLQLRPDQLPCTWWYWPHREGR